MRVMFKSMRKRLILLLLLFFITIIPAKAQLYAGGGFGYHKSEATSTEGYITHLKITPELGYRYQRFSAGLVFSYASETYNNISHTVSYDDFKQYSFEPYIRYDLVVQNGVGFFMDAFYNWTHHSETLYHDSPGPVHVSHLVGLSPGVYYKLSDRFMALFMFGLMGYSSSYEANGFENFGIDLSMNTSRIGFYYSFW